MTHRSEFGDDSDTFGNDLDTFGHDLDKLWNGWERFGHVWERFFELTKTVNIVFADCYHFNPRFFHVPEITLVGILGLRGFR